MIKVNGSYIFVDIETVISELKNQLQLAGINRFYKTIRSGDNIQTCCPFHKDGQEHRPSFGIKIKDSNNIKTGQCHCFTCGWSGSLSEMISNCFGYDDMGAFGSKWLIHNFSSVDVDNRDDIYLDLDRGPKTSKEEIKYVSEEELDSYRWYHPYWAKRGITDEKIIELFDLGYDKNTDCITFPVRDINGNCLFVARRNVRTKFFNYPSGVEKPLYGLYELTKVNYISGSRNQNKYAIIVCESMIDALTCWQYGKYAVALNGLGNNLQFEQLRRLPCRHLILATDNDEAGMKARNRIRKHVPNKIITQYLLPSERKDINELSKDEFYNLKEIF